jgi:hypothetical protein
MLVDGPGSWNSHRWLGLVAGEGEGAARGGFDGDTEQVAAAADVAAGGFDLLDDTVLAQRLSGVGKMGLGVTVADRDES